MRKYDNKFLDKIENSLNIAKNKLKSSEIAESSKMIFVIENQKKLKSIQAALEEILANPDYNLGMHQKANILKDELTDIKTELSNLLLVKDNTLNKDTDSTDTIDCSKEEVQLENIKKPNVVNDNIKKLKDLTVNINDISSDEQYYFVGSAKGIIISNNNMLFKEEDIEEVLQVLSNINKNNEDIYIYKISNIVKAKYKKIFEKENIYDK